MNRIDVTSWTRVQHTLLIPLWARAQEAQRADAILRDPRAVEIVGQIDYDFAAFARESQLAQLVPCVLATIFDRWVRRFLEQAPDGTVVEFGAGLDTRCERLDNGRAHWCEIDLPEVMEVRRQFFAETAHRKMLALSALDSTWIEAVRSLGPGPYLFLAEAVLQYFPPADVRRLFEMVADNFPGAWFAFDSCGTLAQKNSRKLDALRRTGAEFQWGIDDIHEIERWDRRFRVLEVDSVVNHFRHRLPWLVRLVTSAVPGARRLFTVNLTRMG